ncbi:MAG: hypothetical protein AB1298_00525 [Bacteroidota bacterium]
MEKISFIDHKGKKILLYDFSYTKKSDDVIVLIKQAGTIAKKQPPRSILVLTDVTEAHYSVETTQALKELAKENTPYVKASAVTGVTGIKKVIFDAILKFSGRDIKLFNSREEAFDWLVVQ